MYPYLDFISSKKLIKFPFKESTNLPNWFPLNLIVNLIISAKIDEQYYLKELIKTIDHIKITIQNHSNSIEAIITATIGHNNKLYVYQDNDIKLKLIIGNSNANISNGIYNFLQQETIFENCCVIPYANLVRKIIVNNIELIDEIKMLNGYNNEIETEDNVILINAMPNAGLGRPLCKGERYETDFIHSVNGEGYEDNLNINGHECIKIVSYPSENMIAIDDICEPCCKDCDEKLNEINDDTTIVQNDIDDLDARINALENP